MADFGTCWSCVTDLTMPAVMVSGNRVVAEAIVRRLQTPLGGLIDDPNYGYLIANEINDDLSPADVSRIQSGVEEECLKDERVVAADVTVTLTGAGTLVVNILVSTATGPFSLVLGISDVTVAILQVTP